MSMTTRSQAKTADNVQEEEYLFDPSADLRRVADAQVTNSSSRRHAEPLSFFTCPQDEGDLHSIAIMDSLNAKHRVYDWVNFNVRNLSDKRPSPERVQFQYNNGEYSMTRVPAYPYSGPYSCQYDAKPQSSRSYMQPNEGLRNRYRLGMCNIPGMTRRFGRQVCGRKYLTVLDRDNETGLE